MSNEKVTDLPGVTNADLSDIIYAVQGGISSQETLQQVLNLMSDNIILNYAGNPNGNLAGVIYQLCYDTTNSKLYICTSSGSSSTAVWKLVGAVLVSSTQGGTGVSNPTIHTLPVAQGSNAFSFLTLTNGQLLVGSTGADPVPATLTAGTNISISNSAGSITINASGAGGFTWNHVTGTSATLVPYNGYLVDNVGLVTLTLPATSALFGPISIVGFGSGGWTVAQGSSQQIHVGNVASTTGAGGSISSSNRYDSINLICATADTIWVTDGAPQGNITIV